MSEEAEIVDAKAALDDRDRIAILVRVRWKWAQNNPNQTNPHSGKHRLIVVEEAESKRIRSKPSGVETYRITLNRDDSREVMADGPDRLTVKIRYADVSTTVKVPENPYDDETYIPADELHDKVDGAVEINDSGEVSIPGINDEGAEWKNGGWMLPNYDGGSSEQWSVSSSGLSQGVAEIRDVSTALDNKNVAVRVVVDWDWSNASRLASPDPKTLVFYRVGATTDVVARKTVAPPTGGPTRKTYTTVIDPSKSEDMLKTRSTREIEVRLEGVNTRGRASLPSREQAYPNYDARKAYIRENHGAAGVDEYEERHETDTDSSTSTTSVQAQTTDFFAEDLSASRDTDGEETDNTDDEDSSSRSNLLSGSVFASVRDRLSLGSTEQTDRRNRGR